MRRIDETNLLENEGIKEHNWIKSLRQQIEIREETFIFLRFLGLVTFISNVQRSYRCTIPLCLVGSARVETLYAFASPIPQLI